VTKSFAINNPTPDCDCNVIVTLIVTECTTYQAGFELNFQEVFIEPLTDCCPMDAESMEDYTNLAIGFHMAFQDEETIPSCNSGAAAVSNYYKQNCVQYCYTKSGLASIFLCSHDGGCCIEKTRWCRGNDGVAIPIAVTTTTVTGGDCGVGFVECSEVQPGKGGCITARCSE